MKRGGWTFKKMNKFEGANLKEKTIEISGEKQLTVGFVGYPNVGKSSTINKLVGTKKVAVSATPGKTRHFQTIHLDDEVNIRFLKWKWDLNHSILRKNFFWVYFFKINFSAMSVRLPRSSHACFRIRSGWNASEWWVKNIFQRLTNQISANSGILPVDHMRDHFGPIGLLMTRMPLNVLEDAYAMMLPKEGKPSPLSLLTW